MGCCLLRGQASGRAQEQNDNGTMKSMHWLLGVVSVFGMTCPGRTLPAMHDAARPAPAAVRPGIDVLLSDSFHLIRGKRVGLLTNQAGVDHDGVRSVDRLIAQGVQLAVLFSPEHGLRGTADPGAVVASSTDSATGLPIYSLYGESSAPSDAALAGIDAVLVDLQDVGARYYTYLWTTTEVMRAAARHRIPVIVLDRPNPIGDAVQGNVLDPAFRSPIGLLTVPMRHGMTLGELARLAAHDLGIDVDLTVVPVKGWRRAMYWDETGLGFVPPSPNLPRLAALMHYPGLCLFEGTTLSVGRGTDHPFEQVGAPWLDTTALLGVLRKEPHPGVAFEGVAFTPRHPGDGKYADTLLAGIRLSVTDRDRYDPALTAVRLLAAVARQARADAGHSLFPPMPRHFERLLGQPFPKFSARLERDSGWKDLEGEWIREQSEFRARRRRFLLYPE